MPLFVVLGDGAELDDDLTARIKRRIREDCSPRHVPNEVFAIAEVPRTLSGKVLEVPVKRILGGTSPDSAASRDSLQNPAAARLLRGALEAPGVRSRSATRRQDRLWSERPLASAPLRLVSGPSALWPQQPLRPVGERCPVAPTPRA